VSAVAAVPGSVTPGEVGPPSVPAVAVVPSAARVDVSFEVAVIGMTATE
jgi:hypothetical protein